MVKGGIFAQRGEWAVASKTFDAALALFRASSAAGRETSLADLGRSEGVGSGGFASAAYARYRLGDLAGAFGRVVAGRGRALAMRLEQNLPGLEDVLVLPPGLTIVMPLFAPQGAVILIARGTGGGLLHIEAVDLPGVNSDDIITSVFGDDEGQAGYPIPPARSMRQSRNVSR